MSGSSSVCQPLLVIRADGGPGIGVGHLARGLALAQAWSDRRGRVRLATTCAPAEWLDRYRSESGARVVDSGDPNRYEGASWVGIDGYSIESSDDEFAHRAGARVIRVDDFGLSQTHLADLVLDQNVGAAAGTGSALGRRLLGPRYALLRREFDRWKGWSKPIHDHARRVLLALGGSPSAETRTVFERVAARLESRYEIVHLKGQVDVTEALSSCDIAIAAAGSTTWELLCLGVPTIAIPIYDNQIELARGVGALGVACALPYRHRIDVDEVIDVVFALGDDRTSRERLSRAGRALVDGRGAVRVVTRLRADMLKLRVATANDAHQLFAWANDPQTRANAFTEGQIAWDDHVAWLEERLRDPRSAIYIASTDDGVSVGQIRFDRRGDHAEVDVSVDPDQRGRGWAGPLIDAGVRTWFEHARVPQRVVGIVKCSNVASRAAFGSADFSSVDIATAHGGIAVERFERMRERSDG